jgi:FkbM family methyltransferase
MRWMPTGVRKFGWWWECLYRYVGGGGFDDDASIDEKWPAGVHGPVRSRRFGYRVLLDLQLWPERRTYFSGSYFQGDLEYLFPLMLRWGDQYLDIGANIGMTSLMASALIGPEGEGFAFEPNPEIFARLKLHFALNHTTNLQPVPFALSNRETQMELVLPTGHGNTGLAALAVVHQGSGRHVKVQTVTGRHYLERLDPRRPTVIKIDVEGHEVKVLKGMEDVLDWPEVALVEEVNDAMLRRAGDSAEALFELMERHRFRPLLFELRTGRFRREFKITAPGSFRDAIADGWRDVLFVTPDSKLYRERIACCLEVVGPRR